MSKIEWTDKTWEPVQGCTKVSEGCRNCYAERLAKGRMRRFYPEGFNKIIEREDKLKDVTPRQKPSKIFVCSRSDLFHPKVFDLFILDVFNAMVGAGQHIYQILTKHPERMKRFFDLTEDYAVDEWPNIWLGVSVELPKYYDRIRILQNIPTEVRFLSLEPLLSDVPNLPLEGIHWVICGGESGPGARPMDLAWARSARNQCKDAGVPFFMKQIDKKQPIPEDLMIREFPGALK